MAERIKGIKCPITGNNCVCNCEPEGFCFIDVNADAVVRKMSQIASDTSLDVVSKPQLNNVPIEIKLKTADVIKEKAKKRIGKPNRNI